MNSSLKEIFKKLFRPSCSINLIYYHTIRWQCLHPWNPSAFLSVVIQIHSPKEIKLYGQQYFTIRQTATQRENRVIRSHKRGDFALTESRACGIWLKVSSACARNVGERSGCPPTSSGWLSVFHDSWVRYHHCRGHHRLRRRDEVKNPGVVTGTCRPCETVHDRPLQYW